MGGSAHLQGAVVTQVRVIKFGRLLNSKRMLVEDGDGHRAWVSAGDTLNIAICLDLQAKST